jgi:hypothetical protein
MGKITLEKSITNVIEYYFIIRGIRIVTLEFKRVSLIKYLKYYRHVGEDIDKNIL